MGTPGVLSNLIPAGIDAIPRKIRDIERQVMEDRASVAQSFGPVVADLAAKQAALEAQQVILTAQQAALAAQDVQILALIASQISIDGKTAGTTTGVVGVGAYTTMLTVTLPAPAWASRCVVTASAVVGSTSMGGAAAGLWGRITVDGVASESFEFVAQSGGETMSVTPIFMRVFDPGTSVVVALDTRATFGSAGTALARLVASVSYTR